MQPEQLRARLRGHIGQPEQEWLDTACTMQGDRLLAVFVGAARRLGNDRLGGDDAFASWPRSCVARVAMLLSLDNREPQTSSAWIHRAYREGDSGEKRAIVCALPHVREAGQYAELAIDCGRTNETELFAALAIGNAFPADHYPDPAFNSLVIKAAQLDLPLDGILGLLDRHNPELARIGMEYIDERQSAGRPFPPTLWLTIAPSNPPGALARMVGDLQHSVPARRIGAARGLAFAGDSRATSFLEEARAMETQPHVQSAIADAIARINL